MKPVNFCRHTCKNILSFFCFQVRLDLLQSLLQNICITHQSLYWWNYMSELSRRVSQCTSCFCLVRLLYITAYSHIWVSILCIPSSFSTLCYLTSFYFFIFVKFEIIFLGDSMEVVICTEKDRPQILYKIPTRNDGLGQGHHRTLHVINTQHHDRVMDIQ